LRNNFQTLQNGIEFVYSCELYVYGIRYTRCDNKIHELYSQGLVHYEFVPTGQTVNQVYYLEVPKRLCEKKLDGNDPNFLPVTHGSCITTMHLLTRHCL